MMAGEHEDRINVEDFATGADNPFQDDGRRWWFLSANLWTGIHMYQAPNARNALARYRADIAEAEQLNGRSGRETKAYLAGAGFHVVWGPFGTHQAFEIELGMALANAICDNGPGRHVAFSPAALHECHPWVDQRKIDVIYAAVTRHFRTREEQT
jgi:hypothetical protein